MAANNLKRGSFHFCRDSGSAGAIFPRLRLVSLSHFGAVVSLSHFGVSISLAAVAVIFLCRRFFTEDLEVTITCREWHWTVELVEIMSVLAFWMSAVYCNVWSGWPAPPIRRSNDSVFPGDSWLMVSGGKLGLSLSLSLSLSLPLSLSLSLSLKTLKSKVQGS